MPQYKYLHRMVVHWHFVRISMKEVTKVLFAGTLFYVFPLFYLSLFCFTFINKNQLWINASASARARKHICILDVYVMFGFLFISTHLPGIVVVMCAWARMRSFTSSLHFLIYIYIYILLCVRVVHMAFLLLFAFHFQLWIFSFYCVHKKYINSSIWVLPFGLGIVNLVFFSLSLILTLTLRTFATMSNRACSFLLA